MGQRTMRRRRWARWVAAISVGMVLLSVIGTWLWTLRSPVARREIFQGIFYTCERVPETAESGGLLHLVEVDLSAPGVDLYVTPMHPDALAAGWQYEMDWPWWQGRAKGLAVAVNATLFTAADGKWSLPGTLARSSETVVSQGMPNHIDPHSYLVWFEKDLTPHVEVSKPPSATAIARAWWGVSGQGISIHDGKVSAFAGNAPDTINMLGVDPKRKRLWLAVFEKASQQFAAQALAERGAVFGTQLDSGDSTCMFLGWGAKGVRPGTVRGGWRPVAVTFGVRATELE